MEIKVGIGVEIEVGIGNSVEIEVENNMNNNGVIKYMQGKLKILLVHLASFTGKMKRMLQFRAGSSLRVLNVETELINSNQSNL